MGNKKSTLNISKSLLNAYDDYLEQKLCGTYFEASYIDKVVRDKPTRPRIAGQYFEYKAIGYTSGEDKLLDGQLKEVGLITKSGNPSTELQRIDEQAERFKIQMKKLGFKILGVGEMIEDDGYKLILDIRCQDTSGKVTGIKDEEFVIDLKLTGLMDNKWDEWGWDPGSLEYKEKILIQAKLTEFIWLNKYKKTIPYYFWVFSKGSDMDQNLFEVRVAPDSMMTFATKVEEKKKRIFQDYIDGFVPLPEYNRCRECPFYDKCDHKTDEVHARTIIV